MYCHFFFASQEEVHIHTVLQISIWNASPPLPVSTLEMLYTVQWQATFSVGLVVSTQGLLCYPLLSHPSVILHSRLGYMFESALFSVLTFCSPQSNSRHCLKHTVIQSTWNTTN